MEKTEIQKWREQAGLNRPQMSKEMDIPVRTIENWEAGKTEPPVYVERLVIKELQQKAQQRIAAEKQIIDEKLQ